MGYASLRTQITHGNDGENLHVTSVRNAIRALLYTSEHDLTNDQRQQYLIPAANQRRYEEHFGYVVCLCFLSNTVSNAEFYIYIYIYRGLSCVETVR